MALRLEQARALLHILRQCRSNGLYSLDGLVGGTSACYRADRIPPMFAIHESKEQRAHPEKRTMSSPVKALSTEVYIRPMNSSVLAHRCGNMFQ